MIINKLKKRLLNTRETSDTLFNDKYYYDKLDQFNKVPIPDIGYSTNKENIDRWIIDGISCFKEWYQPVDFGGGIVAHVTIPPKWETNPSLINDNTRGLAKWGYILKRNIPDVRGKRILDLGCSSGLFSIELARMGAREVIAIDRDEEIMHKSTSVPPPQNVIRQAKFVTKAIELIDGNQYPIKHIAHDISKIDELDLGKFDLIVSFCVIYHELENMSNIFQMLSGMSNHLVLQANNSHKGRIGSFSNVSYHSKLFLEHGYTKVEIDAPSGYPLPVIIGIK